MFVSTIRLKAVKMSLSRLLIHETSVLDSLHCSITLGVTDAACLTEKPMTGYKHGPDN